MASSRENGGAGSFAPLPMTREAGQSGTPTNQPWVTVRGAKRISSGVYVLAWLLLGSALASVSFTYLVVLLPDLLDGELSPANLASLLFGPVASLAGATVFIGICGLNAFAARAAFRFSSYLAEAGHHPPSFKSAGFGSLAHPAAIALQVLWSALTALAPTLGVALLAMDFAAYQDIAFKSLIARLSGEGNYAYGLQLIAMYGVLSLALRFNALLWLDRILNPQRQSLLKYIQNVFS